MNDKDKNSQDVCCQKESSDMIASCDCQGICTCDNFIYDDEKFDCENCCCDE